MNRTIQIAPVHKTITVRATPTQAFDMFTLGIDLWWPKKLSLGPTEIRESVIEPFVGGRWYESCQDGSDVVIGHVRVWQPPERFVVTWEITAQWKPGLAASLASEVEVRFIPEANDTTRVELEHRGFDRLGPVDGDTMRQGVDNGWPSRLIEFAQAAEFAARSEGDRHP